MQMRIGLALCAVLQLIAPSIGNAERGRRANDDDDDDNIGSSSSSSSSDDEDSDDDDLEKASSRAPGDDLSDRTESIGLDDLIGSAVRRSPDLIRIKAERKSARELSRAAAAPDEWQLAGSFDWSSGTAARIDGQPVQQVGQITLDTQLGATKRLPTGGALSLSVSHQRLYQKFAVAVQQASGAVDDLFAETVGHVATARIGVIQPLLRGRGSTVSQAGRHQAELSAQIAQVKARYDAAVLVHDLVATYWEIAYSSADVAVRRDSIKAAREQLAAAKDLWKAGVLPVSALKAAEYAVAVREEALLRATLSLEEVSLAARNRAGLEVGPHDIALTPTDAFVLDADDVRVDEVLAQAREGSPRVEGARLGLALADIDVALGEDGVAPSVDFRASAAAVGGGDDMGEAINGIGQGQSYEVSAGVGVAYEIGGASRARARAARESRTAASTDVEIVQREVVVAVVSAVHRVRAARKRAEVAAKAIEVAMVNLKAEQNAFRAGRQTSYIVLERQTEVDEARLLQARAVADFHQAVAAVQLQSGIILSRWGVEVRDRK
jgi:outer membrane protein TolC